MAHAYEYVKGDSMNGYSTNYHYFIKLCSFVYGMLGLWFMFLMLRKLFDVDIARIVCSLTLLGSNLLWFTYFQSGMAHVPVFFLYAMFLWNCLWLFEKPTWARFLLMGFLGGMITIIRPTDILLLLFPLLYQVYSIESLFDKMKFIRTHALKLFGAGLMFIMPLIPQMLFWKKYAGSFLYYSYNDQGFSWEPKQIYEGLFGMNNGWLAYSPMMIFSLVGLLFVKKLKPYFLSIVFIFVAYVLVIYSWWCYTYMNGFGSRPMIHLYPLLGISFSVFIQWLLKRKVWVQVPIWVTFFLMAFVNISLSIHMAKGNLDSNESNLTYNQAILFKSSVNYGDLLKLDLNQRQPQENTLEKLSTLGQLNFEDSTASRYKSNIFGHEGKVMEITSSDEYNPNLSCVLPAMSAQEKYVIHCSGDFYVQAAHPNDYTNSLLVLDVQRHDSVVLWKSIHINNKIGYKDSLGKSAMHAAPRKGINNCWGNIPYYIKLPEGLLEGDKISLSIWNLGWAHIYIDNLKLVLFKQKKVVN